MALSARAIGVSQPTIVVIQDEPTADQVKPAETIRITATFEASHRAIRFRAPGTEDIIELQAGADSYTSRSGS